MPPRPVAASAGRLRAKIMATLPLLSLRNPRRIGTYLRALIYQPKVKSCERNARVKKHFTVFRFGTREPPIRLRTSVCRLWQPESDHLCWESRAADRQHDILAASQHVRH